MENFLFWFQIVMAFVYTVPLISNIINGKVAGLTLAMFVLFLLFVAMGFSLAISSYKESKSRIRLQTVFIYGNWLLLIGAIVAVGIFTITWRAADSVFTGIIAGFTLATMLWYRGLKNPMAKSWISIWCKSLPQIWLAYTMLFIEHSAAGFALTSLIAGHLTSMPRIMQIYLSGRKDGWDRPTKALVLSESANVATWWVVTLVWLWLYVSL